jgi:hypothetical protein
MAACEGVKFYACKMTMDMMGLTEGDLLGNVEITDAKNFMERALNSEVNMFMLGKKSELVQLKLNIGASDGDSTPSEVKRGTPTYEVGVLKN